MPAPRAKQRGHWALIGIAARLKAGKYADLAIWNIDSPAELVYRMGFNPLHSAYLERSMIAIVLRPGSTTLADWRAIYRGATPKLDPACHADVEKSAQAVARIVARGKPVYGINTGFGKLAQRADRSR